MFEVEKSTDRTEWRMIRYVKTHTFVFEGCRLIEVQDRSWKFSSATKDYFIFVEPPNSKNTTEVSIFEDELIASFEKSM